MGITTLEEAFFDEGPDMELENDIEPVKKRGRPPKKHYWRKIERYWEHQQLKHEVEDILFQDEDSELMF